MSQGSMGLVRLCSVVDVLLLTCRGILAVLPAIILWATLGTSSGNRGITARVRIKITSKYSISTAAANSRAGLPSISDASSITSVVVRRATKIVVTRFPLAVWAGTVVGAFSLR